jgi:hypothetical protein
MLVSHVPLAGNEQQAREQEGEIEARGHFEIGVFEVGSCKACLYSCFCTPCALGESRHVLDGADPFFTCFCLQPAALRWMVRSAYNIGGKKDYKEDCFLGTCCIPCVTNQIYQTTAVRGNPTHDGGMVHNTLQGPFELPKDRLPIKLCYSFCCMPCSVATTMNDAMGMPYWLGFCCVNICAARNLVRYQYRLKPESGDAVDECIGPAALYCAGQCLQNTMCPCAGCVVGGMLAAYQLDTATKVEQRRAVSGPGYLFGYTPPPSQQPMRTQVLTSPDRRVHLAVPTGGAGVSATVAPHDVHYGHAAAVPTPSAPSIHSMHMHMPNENPIYATAVPAAEGYSQYEPTKDL